MFNRTLALLLKSCQILLPSSLANVMGLGKELFLTFHTKFWQLLPDQEVVNVGIVH